MILWCLYKARQMEETIEQIKIEARAEGRTQNYLLWAAWNNRHRRPQKRSLTRKLPLNSAVAEAARVPLCLSESGFSGFKDFQDRSRNVKRDYFGKGQGAFSPEYPVCCPSIPGSLSLALYATLWVFSTCL